MPITTREKCFEMLKQECFAFNVSQTYAEEYTDQLERQNFTINGAPIQNMSGMFRRWLEKVKGEAVAKNSNQRRAMLASSGSPTRAQKPRTYTDPEGHTFRRIDAITNAPTPINRVMDCLIIGELCKNGGKL